MHPPIDAVLFDFDGVLADTEPLHWECWNQAIAPLGMTISWPAYAANCIGISDRKFLETLGRVSTPQRTLEELWPVYPDKKRIFATRAAMGGIMPADNKALLAGLDGLKLALVTSSARQEIEPLLRAEGVLELFDTRVYGDDVNNLKPHPEPYLTAIERLGARAALALEDSGPGIASARAAGCEVLEIRNAAETAARLRARLGLA